MRKRLVITFGREDAPASWRLRVAPAALIACGALLVASPLLLTAGATWAAGTVVTDLLGQNAALEMENASYRDATTELVTQIATLQAAADDLRTRAPVDPEAARAMSRLPSSITHPAMGGSGLGDVATPIAAIASTADPAFGLLRDVLHVLERQLDRARAGVERREALAAATPSIWPVAGWLSSTFGRRADPFTGGPDFHAGIDISAARGQPVRATAAGTVLEARFNGNLGNMVVIDHGFGITTRYGHMSKIAVSPGQQLKKGDVLGFVGSTGRSTSPHLHYELLLNGRHTNPLRLLGR